MNDVKLFFYIVIGVALGNLFSLKGYEWLKESENQTTIQVLKPATAPEIKHVNEGYNGLETPRVNVTISNGSDHELRCVVFKGKEMENFLTLSGNENRSFSNVKEGENIGCNIAINNGSSTILNWFSLKESGVYMALLEQVECKTCKGVNYAWATVIVKPNGEKIYREI